ncbi:phosphate signaling complex PhoU family protein [Parafrankia elaeagni]|uniref:phosphate signaling complex PhoU family protein n=1 Tax=Parafrankia elaeagni TaxID=222534 RepID=UPI000368115D|nr:PhoU domain-containing protein [Parafrankia elaeagni]
MDVPSPHRFAYTEALDRIRVVLSELASETRQMVTDATTAVAGPGAGNTDTAPLHATGKRIRDRSDALDDDLVMLLALEAPVAGDLRLILGALRIAAAIERMAGLASHIAAVADRRAPAPALPAPLHPTITRLGELCAHLVAQLVTAINSQDPAAPQRVEDADDPIDETHRSLLAAVTSPDWPHGIEAAIDLALLSRFYERFGDQAVTAARQLARIDNPTPDGASATPV